MDASSLAAQGGGGGHRSPGAMLGGLAAGQPPPRVDRARGHQHPRFESDQPSPRQAGVPVGLGSIRGRSCPFWARSTDFAGIRHRTECVRGMIAAESSRPLVCGDRNRGAVMPGDWLVLQTADRGSLWREAAEFEYVALGGAGNERQRSVTSDYLRWADKTVFHLLVDGIDLVAVVRTVVGPLEDLPFARVVDGVEFGGSLATCQFGPVAVTPERRSDSEVLAVLLWSALAQGRDVGAQRHVALASRSLWYVLRSRLGIPFERLGRCVRYGGEDVIPVGASAGVLHEAFSRHGRSTRY